MKIAARIAQFGLLGYAFILFSQPASALEDPVQWALPPKASITAPGGKVSALLTATIDPGWHLYSLTTPKGGPNPTTVTITDTPGVAGVRVYQPKPVREMDPNFQIETETFTTKVQLLLEVALNRNVAPGPLDLEVKVRYQSCNNRICLPPRVKTAHAVLQVKEHVKIAALTIPPGYFEAAAIGDVSSLGVVASRPETRPKKDASAQQSKPTAASPAAQSSSDPASEPAGQSAAVPAQASSAKAESFAPAAAPTAPPVRDANTLGFLLTAFGFGLAAIFTPCVFPMIPITVSFFLNQGKQDRRGTLMQVLVFCLGIVVLFTSLGAIAKAVAGPFGVVVLGSSPWVNGFVTLVFIAFGLSLLGAYEITLPSSMLTSLDKASRGGGYFGTLVMGLTFSLTAFACVGPIVGPLLMASVDSNGLRPVFGMICFATGLACPFFLLALFPSYLKKLPRSGEWMIRIKVVLGFIILAAALKYLGNIDQVLQLGLLTRGRFLAAWIIMFTMPGLYLLGLLRMEGIDAQKPVGVGRVLCGSALLIFAVSLIPGLWGSPLGELDAYIPAAAPTAASGGLTKTGPVWLKNQYKEALAQAANSDKLVLVNFTGYACTNCHWMKANMFTRPEISATLPKFVLVDLFTDGTDADSERNQDFEGKVFSTVAIPFYAIVDPQGKVLATFPGLTRNPQEFLAFLSTPNGKQVAGHRSDGSPDRS